MFELSLRDDDLLTLARIDNNYGYGRDTQY